MYKKFISVFLLLFLFSLPFSEASTFTEKPAWAPEIITDGGFESNTGIWKLSSNSCVSITDEAKRSGSCSLKITNPDSTYSHWANQTLSGSYFHAGAVYQSSAYIYVPTKASVGFKYEWYDTAGTMMGQTHQIIETRSEGFTLFTNTFEMPSDCHRFKFYARLYSPGTVYFDNISFYMIQKPPVYALSMETDEIFYYSDMQNGFADITLHTDAFPDATRFTFDAKLSKLNGPAVYTKENLSSGGTSSFRISFPLSVMEEGEEYILSLDAYDNDGTYVETVKEKIMKYARPSMLSKGGQILVDEEPFYPVVAYHVRPSELQYVKQIGANTAQSTGDFLGCLDEAERLGMKILIRLYADMLPAGHPDQVQNTISTINLVKDHPALLGYMVMDEASMYFPNHWEYFYDSYKLIRDMDPDHLIYMLENSSGYYEKMGKYVDILAVDPYPHSAASHHVVADKVQKASESVKEHKPVCSIISTFLNGGYFPTIDEVRHMWYSSLFAGADMVGFFGYYSAYTYVDATTGQTVKLPLKDTPLWDGLVEFSRAEMSASYNHFLRHKYPVFGEKTGEDFSWSGYVKDGTLHLIVMNMQYAETDVSIPLLSDNKKVSIGAFSAETLWGGTGIFRGNGTFNVTLPANAVRVYKITPTVPVNAAYLPLTDSLSKKESLLHSSEWSAVGSASVSDTGMVTISSPEDIHSDYASQKVMLEKGRKYTLCFDYKTTAPGAYPRFRLSYPAGYFEIQSATYICDNTMQGTNKMTIPNAPLPRIQDTEWHALRYDFFVPDHNLHSDILIPMTLHLKASDSDSGTYYFDNVRLVPSGAYAEIYDTAQTPLSVLPKGKTVSLTYSPAETTGTAPNRLYSFSLYEKYGDTTSLSDFALHENKLYSETNVLGYTVYEPTRITSSFNISSSVVKAAVRTWNRTLSPTDISICFKQEDDL